ncbi:MAG: hypothetical protein PVH63_06895 [Balneolaceae bacterium]|jgi:hypothetical protein
MRYIFSEIFFGFVLVKSEVISWFRIQEMFHFDAIHMYGIIGSAVLVAAISIQLIERWSIPDAKGDPITVKPKDMSQYKRYILGGIIFGYNSFGECHYRDLGLWKVPGSITSVMLLFI